MFYNDLREKSLSKLKQSQDRYEKCKNQVEEECLKLYNKRKMIKDDVIKPVENYINTLAKSPMELKKSVQLLSVQYNAFAQAYEIERADADKIDNISEKAAGGGAVIGLGVGALAPTAAMAVATTFGTASTGAAIAGLNGVAATNAALAWLGGGALSVGGGGMVAGKALLAMAGPVGWGIAGAAIAGGSLWKSRKNKEIAIKSNEYAMKYDNEYGVLSVALIKVQELHNLTCRHSAGVKEQLRYLKNYAPTNYLWFTEEDKKEMASLTNNVNSLSELIKKRID